MKACLLAVLVFVPVGLGATGFAAPSVVASDAVTITADGANSYVGNVATADDHVVCHFHDCTLTADHLTYNRLTHTLVASGNAKLFKGETHGTVSGPKIEVPDCSAAPLHFVVTGANTPVTGKF